MFYYLHNLRELGEEFGIFNIFRYISFRAAAAAFFSFIICILIGPRIIRRLRQAGVGEEVGKTNSRQLNCLHSNKQGTPTMGGIVIIISLVSSTLLWARWDVIYIPLVLATVISLGLVGLVDDYVKLRFIKKKGLRAKTKLGIQLVIGLLLASILYIHFTSPASVIRVRRKTPQNSFAGILFANDDGREARTVATEIATGNEVEGVEQDVGEVMPVTAEPGTTLQFPFFKDFSLQLGVCFILFAILVLAGSSNAVNLTDGMDGLAIGCIAAVGTTFAVVSYIVGRADFSSYLRVDYIPGAGELTIFCAALVGTSLGFLWFNSYPAQLFMGDVGSLPLGGAIGLVAVMLKQEFLLVIAGGIFVAEAVSVIAQVLSFKLTGKRILRIAPLHHHFEFAHIHESKITVRFWIVAMMLALVSLITLKLR